MSAIFNYTIHLCHRHILLAFMAGAFAFAADVLIQQISR